MDPEHFELLADDGDATQPVRRTPPPVRPRATVDVYAHTPPPVRRSVGPAGDAAVDAPTLSPTRRRATDPGLTATPDGAPSQTHFRRLELRLAALLGLLVLALWAVAWSW